MENSMNVYINAMKDSLSRKLNVVKSLLQLTKKQEELLRQESLDMGEFNSIITEKEKVLRELKELDKGFDALFARCDNELKEKKYFYQSQILEMQNLIRSITDCGIQIEGLEKKNKELFQQHMTGARKEIKSFKVSNKTASSYYQNMANQHREWQSYFLDQKK